MKCLYLFANAPLSENYHGAANRYQQAFKALIQVGAEVHVVRLLADTRKEEITAFERAEARSRSNDLAQSWRDIGYRNVPAHSSRIKRGLKGLLQPLHFAFPELATLREPVIQTIETIQPDFIVAQMYPAGAVLASLQPDIPWVFGHHDWTYRDSSLRLANSGNRRSLGTRFRYWVKRNAEITVVRRSDVVIAASATEGPELRRLGAKQVFVIPATYESVPAPSIGKIPQEPLRIIHFGQLTTHANAIGLRDYLNQVAPVLPSNWEFQVIGSFSGADAKLIDSLREKGATLTGRVDDLATILRPFDVAVIPYRHNTGERTKVAQLFNYSQVVVAHEKAVAGVSYTRSGENCFVLPDLKSFPETLMKLANDKVLRKHVGLAAKTTFERELILEAQLPQYEKAFMTCLKRN